MKVYTVYPPTIPSGVVNFSFTSHVAGDAWTFAFRWNTDHWETKVTLPTNVLRMARAIPEVLNWSRYTDYYISFSLGQATRVGLGDIANIAIHVFYVKG